jgi:hypothetical protein
MIIPVVAGGANACFPRPAQFGDPKPVRRAGTAARLLSTHCSR